MRIAFKDLRKNRFYVTIGKKEITFRCYQRMKPPFCFRFLFEMSLMQGDLMYDLTRWANAGCDMPTSYAYALASRFKLKRDDTTAIIHYKY